MPALVLLCFGAFGYGVYRIGYNNGTVNAKALARKVDINLPKEAPCIAQ